MAREKLIDLAAVIVIMFAGLLIAYVCFGILESQASADIKRYSLEGSIAGALVSMGLLASIYMRFRKSSETVRKLEEANRELKKTISRGDELKTLRQQNKELEQKLLRGAPHPPKYQIEISERQKIVLARPAPWEPTGGIIFNFELPEELLEGENIFPPRFELSFVPTKGLGIKSIDDFYEEYRQSIYDADTVKSHTAEFVFLGGEFKGVKSLKIIAHEFVELQSYPDSITGKIVRSSRNLTVDEYETRVAKFAGAIEENANGTAQSQADSNAELRENMGSLTEGRGTASDSAGEPCNKQNETSDSESHQRAGPPQEAQASTSEIAEHLVDQLDQSAQERPQEEPGAQKPTETQGPDADELTVTFTIFEIRTMRVICYNEEAGNVYIFDFKDDLSNFAETSALFNQILNSVRFLT